MGFWKAVGGASAARIRRQITRSLINNYDFPIFFFFFEIYDKQVIGGGPRHLPSRGSICLALHASFQCPRPHSVVWFYGKPWALLAKLERERVCGGDVSDLQLGLSLQW